MNLFQTPPHRHPPSLKFVSGAPGLKIVVKTYCCFHYKKMHNNNDTQQLLQKVLKLDKTDKLK